MTTSSATSNSFLSFLPLVSCHLFFLLSTFHLSCRPLFLRLLLLLQTESFTCGSWALSAPLLHAHLLLTPPQRAYHLLHNTYTHIRIHIWIQLSNVIEACHVAVGCTFNVRMGRSGNCERVCACVCKLFITPWNANDSRGEGAATLCRSFPILRGLCAGGERERGIEAKQPGDESPIREARKSPLTGGGGIDGDEVLLTGFSQRRKYQCE